MPTPGAPRVITWCAQWKRACADFDADRIDLYYLHRFDDVTALDETLRGVEGFWFGKAKFYIRRVTNYTTWQVAHAHGLQRAATWAPLVAIQPMYNLVKRQAEVELLPMAEALGMGVITYSPTGGGLLTGKYGRTVRPNTGRLVENKMYQTRYADAALFEIADGFRALAAERGIAPATLATAWVLQHRAVTSVLLGARTVAQLQETLAAATYRSTHKPTQQSARCTGPTRRSNQSQRRNFGA